MIGCMKIPDGDMIRLWLCEIGLGILCSLAFSRFGEIPFFYSVWFTIPLFFISGELLINTLYKKLEKEFQKQQTPLGKFDVPGLGTIYRFPDYWDYELTTKNKEGANFLVPITLSADLKGPSDRQINLLKTFKGDFVIIYATCLKELKKGFIKKKKIPLFDAIDKTKLSLHLNPDHDTQEDMEFTFETSEPDSDMSYTLTMKNWQIINIYGID